MVRLTYPQVGPSGGALAGQRGARQRALTARRVVYREVSTVLLVMFLVYSEGEGHSLLLVDNVWCSVRKQPVEVQLAPPVGFRKGGLGVGAPGDQNVGVVLVQTNVGTGSGDCCSGGRDVKKHAKGGEKFGEERLHLWWWKSFASRESDGASESEVGAVWVDCEQGMCACKKQ